MDRSTTAGVDEARQRHPLKQRFCEMPFTGAAIRDVLRYMESRSVNDSFGYLVTPNVDHVVRNWRDGGELVEIYEAADLSLCDSRILSLIGKLCRVSLPVVTGSDLTAILFDYIIDPDERVTIIGGSNEVVAKVAQRYGLRQVRHHNPPMGFVRDPVALLEAAQFVEHNPARFIFLAVGSPQQEILAHAIRQRGHASGLGLCIGASLLFITGDVQRAPVWMQRANIEWLHRLLQEPRRMWRRYLYEGPKILRIASSHMAQQRTKTAPRTVLSIIVPTLGHEELLPPLIENCCGQAGINPEALELVVIDRTGDGAARPIVERVGAQVKAAVHYLHHPQAGLDRALAAGIAQSRGPLLAFLGDQTLPSPAWLEAMLKTQRIYAASMVLGPIRPWVEAGSSGSPGDLGEYFARDHAAATGTSVPLIAPPALALSRSRPPRLLSNALLSRDCYQEAVRAIEKPLGASGLGDLVFLAWLQRAGKRATWCQEAVVRERVTVEQLRPRALLAHEWRHGRDLAIACRKRQPSDRAALAQWIAIGLCQLVLGSLRGLLWPVARRQGMWGLCTAASGLGKLMFLQRRGRRDPAAYAGSAASAPAEPAAIV